MDCLLSFVLFALSEEELWPEVQPRSGARRTEAGEKQCDIHL